MGGSARLTAWDRRPPAYRGPRTQPTAGGLLTAIPPWTPEGGKHAVNLVGKAKSRSSFVCRAHCLQALRMADQESQAPRQLSQTKPSNLEPGLQAKKMSRGERGTALPLLQGSETGKRSDEGRAWLLPSRERRALLKTHE